MIEILIGSSIYVLVVYPAIKTWQLIQSEAKTVRQGTMPTTDIVIGD